MTAGCCAQGRQVQETSRSLSANAATGPSITLPGGVSGVGAGVRRGHFLGPIEAVAEVLETSCAEGCLQGGRPTASARPSNCASLSCRTRLAPLRSTPTQRSRADRGRPHRLGHGTERAALLAVAAPSWAAYA